MGRRKRTDHGWALTGEQIRAARALARLDQSDLAIRAGVSLETIKRLERIRGPVDAKHRTMRAIQRAFEGAGVALDHAGVRVMRAEAGGAEEASQHPAGDLWSIIYFSTASADSSQRMKAVLDQIFATAGLANIRHKITGALLACDGRFLQLIEGPHQALLNLYASIESDSRHHSLNLLENRSVATRRFPNWSLCCGVFRSDMSAFAHEPAMHNGFRPEALTPMSAIGLLMTMAELESVRPRYGARAAGPCPLARHCRDELCVKSAATVLAEAS